MCCRWAVRVDVPQVWRQAMWLWPKAAVLISPKNSSSKNTHHTHSRPLLRLAQTLHREGLRDRKSKHTYLGFFNSAFQFLCTCYHTRYIMVCHSIQIDFHTLSLCRLQANRYGWLLCLSTHHFLVYVLLMQAAFIFFVKYIQVRLCKITINVEGNVKVREWCSLIYRQTSKAAALLQAQQAQQQAQQQKQQAVMSALSQQLTADTTTAAEPSNEIQIVDENGEPVNWQDDPNEPRYCLCNQVSYGEMVGCDNDDVCMTVDSVLYFCLLQNLANSLW